MDRYQLKQRRLQLLRQKLKNGARGKLSLFLNYTNPSYDRQWFHTLIADKCQQLFEGRIQKLMIFVPPQHGKALDVNTPVLTTKGWVKHGDLKLGDYVFGYDGQPKKVIANTGKYEWHCQCVKFASGIEMIAAKEHEWIIYADHDDHKGRVREIVETQNIFKGRHRRHPFIKADSVLHGNTSSLPIDPYILGLWLGDGCSNYGCIISGKEDSAYYKSLGIGEIRKVKKDYYRLRVYGLTTQLREAGLLNNKHIPMPYLLADEQSRWSLLQGLMDTDGCVDKRGNCEFCQKQGNLAEDVYTLLRTLGLKARKKEYNAMLYGKYCGKKTRILFSPDRTQSIFRLPRKQLRLTNKTNADRDDKKKFFIYSVEDISDRYVNCIQVEGGIYLAGRDLVPTHNSEIVSRRFPAWVFGQNPMYKIAGCSYSADLAEGFSRSIQLTMDSPEYLSLFPGSALPQRGGGGLIRNVDFFNTLSGGFFKAVGVTGGLTGTPVDLAIIDDPVKDKIEAYSPQYRERVWDWYTDVLLTRLHNNSKQLLIMTRWHPDDLAGRILKKEPDEWTIVCLPAIKEDDGNPEDPREVGAALWPERHSLERLKAMEQRSPRTFAALYQQHPSIQGGNIWQKNWFKVISQSAFAGIKRKEITIHFFIDTAYTKNTGNDPTGILAACRIGNNMYILDAVSVYKNFPELIRFVPDYVLAHGYTEQSTIRIEPKANGISVVDQLQEETSLNVVQTPPPSDSKEVRANANSAKVECGRVYIVEGEWNEGYLFQVSQFPAVAHDEFVDITNYAIDYLINDNIEIPDNIENILNPGI